MEYITGFTTGLFSSSISVKVYVSDRIKDGFVVIIDSTVGMKCVYEIRVSDVQYVSCIIGPAMGCVQTCKGSMLEI